MGLDPGDFSWGEALTASRVVGPGQEPVFVSVLTHDPTGYWFTFDLDTQSRHHCTFRPGIQSPEEKHFPGGWDEQLHYVREWLRGVKEDWEAADIWQEYQAAARALPPGGESNTAFTQEERARIEQQLRAVLETVRETHALTREQYAALDAEVEDVLEATQRLARRDWRGYFIGAMVEVAVTHALSGSALSDLLNLTLHGLSQLFGGGLPALP
jgi:hypothetical protein